MVWVAFGVGLFVGTFVGIFTIGLMNAGKDPRRVIHYVHDGKVSVPMESEA